MTPALVTATCTGGFGLRSCFHCRCRGEFHRALWELRASYRVCAWRAGREHLLAYLRGDVDQWQRVMAEGTQEGPLPAAARTALAEAAAALQAELDVAQQAGGGM